MPFDTFGGGVAQPSDVSYRAVALSASVTLEWPNLSNTSTDVAARIMNVTPSAGSLAITMPPANQVSVGQDALFRNMTATTFTVKDNAGNTIATVTSGLSIYIYLTDNSTVAGTWSNVTFGAGTSSADAATLAGYGLKAITTTLNQSHTVTTKSANYTVLDADRATALVWTSGSYTATLPTSASVGNNWFVIIKNSGAGTLTIDCSGADTIDGDADLALAPDEGVMVFADGGTAFYTIAQGRAVDFAFTQLVKSVAGSSNVTLTTAECANKVMTFTGTLTGNINVYVTNTVSVYYVYNNTSGAFTLTVSTAAGSGVAVSQGIRDTLVCDATNVYRAVSISNTTTEFGAGSVSAPSITFVGDTNTGFYLPAADTPGVAAGGVNAMRWNYVASAVNYWAVYPSATGNAIYMAAEGTDASISLALRPKGASGTVILQDNSGTSVVTVDDSLVTVAQALTISSGALTVTGGTITTGATTALSLATTGGTQVQVTNTATAVEYIGLTGAASGGEPTLSAIGAATNLTLALTSKGTGGIRFKTNASAVEQVRIIHVASADRYIELGGGAAAAPTLKASSDRLRLPEGIYIGADSTNNLLDDASTGAGTATLYIGNASINVTSDEHLKSNIKPLADGLSIIKALAPIEYDQDRERPFGHVRHYVGFGARHSYKVAPWAVHTQGDTGLPWQMRQEFLMAPAVRAIQQIEERLTVLEARQ